MSKLVSKILDYVGRPGYKPLKAKELAKKLGLKKKHQTQFRADIDSLLASDQLLIDRKGQLRGRRAPGMISGLIKRVSSGAGYLIPHEKTDDGANSDLYIAARDLGDAHTGDEVVVRVLDRRREGGQRCGRVEQILVRATSHFVGTYFERDGYGYVQVDGKTFSDPVYVGDPGAKGAHPDDKVVIEMLRFPSHLQGGEAVLTEVLGARGKPGVDLLTIVHEFGLRDAFPDEVLEEARVQAERFDEADLEGRRDLTRETIVTIDPVDARDFDDAISLSRSKDGHWHLGVHIADVAHFVEEGSALDREALARGTSTYLPGRVLPMLPELISNGLASLQQGKLRFTKSVFVEFTADGIPVHTAFANSAVNVTRRFAYEQVLPIIREPEKFKTRVSAKVRKLLADMYELAMILRKRRFKAGALELNLPEVELQFGTEGEVTGARESEHDESHQIIEEFMLAANVAVAIGLDDRGIPLMRRVHADPDEVKLKAFAQFVSAMGFPLKRFQSRHDLQELLDRVKASPAAHAVNYGLLRSMKAAEYTGLKLGHYALAVDNYCHFTSPIRRYPDLTVHRLIGQLAVKDGDAVGPSELELVKLGKLCSAAERRAAAAERELTKVKLLTYMAERVGSEMNAVITGVERFGLFCQGLEIPVDGMVHISWLSADDHFYYDQATFSLIGRRSGRQYRLGDYVRVRVAHVDVDRRELDFRIVGPAVGLAATPASPDTEEPAAQDSQRASVGKKARQRKSDSGKAAGSRSNRRPVERPAERVIEQPVVQSDEQVAEKPVGSQRKKVVKSRRKKAAGQATEQETEQAVGQPTEEPIQKKRKEATGSNSKKAPRKAKKKGGGKPPRKADGRAARKQRKKAAAGKAAGQKRKKSAGAKAKSKSKARKKRE